MRPPRRLAAAAVLTPLLAVLGVPDTVPSAQAATVQRFAGADRYATAVAASSATFTSAGTVVLAAGTSTVDALASSYVAAAFDGPVLLTGRDEVPAATMAEIERLGADTVVLAGGPAAIGPAVQAQLGEFTVRRAAGADRYETSARLVGLVAGADPDTIFLASGPADAAAVGPVAAALGAPVLLISPDAPSPASLGVVQRFPNADVVVLGGQRAVPEAVASVFGADDRIAGADRYETAVRIADHAIDQLGMPANGFGLANGSGDLADALASGPVLGRVGAPLLLTSTLLGPHVAGFLADRAATIPDAGLVFGGAAAVPPAVVEAATTGVGDPPTAAPPPAGAVVDYQLGGAYVPDPAVRVVIRDRETEPAAGRYSICYVNAFQTQPGEADFWLTQHPDLLLRAGGQPVEDPAWPGEYLLDTTSTANRAALAEIVGGWIDGCAAAGFQAVEPDNLDTWTRSGGLLTRQGNLEFVRLLAARAHRDGLAIAQKNAAELTAAEVAAAGFDFVVTESCQVYDECAAYTDLYGDHVVEIEYTDDGEEFFTAACAVRGGRVSVLLRDRDVVPRGEAGYRYEWC
ncbi:endo alpha-1,4 polygalactosaminidase [Kineococcus sp. SYSU DK003]|uniref:endo alpha-1,4 polygalactosaminidase n=1 Tax=Kineococcus sp. SYSU DK003 TaxID=3383124 RepID=UPI003D7DCE26